MADTATGAHTYWLNGIVKLNGTDLATINEVDGPVELLGVPVMTEHAGSRPYAVEAHTVGGRITIKLSASVLKMQQFRVLMGYQQSSGYLDDGITPAAIFSITNCGVTYGKRPVVELLIQGTKSCTGKIVQIHAVRAVLISDQSFLMDKVDMAKPELEFLILGDLTDRCAVILSIKDEDLGS